MHHLPSGAGHGDDRREAESAQVSRERMLALTDGVVAIAMTLLVLDVELPRGLGGSQLDTALRQVAAQVWTFLLSAVVIALFWRGHHVALRRTERIDTSLFWLNLAFLIILCLIPFPTSVLEDYIDQPLGPGLYGAVIGLGALLLYAIESRANRMAEPAERRSVPLPAQAFVFLSSTAVAVVSPVAALYSWLASIPLSALANRLAARADRASGRPHAG